MAEKKEKPTKDAGAEVELKPSDRAANEYAAAANAAIKIAEIAIPLIVPEAKAARAAKVVATAAPVVKAAAEHLPDMIPVVKPAFDKASEAMKERSQSKGPKENKLRAMMQSSADSLKQKSQEVADAMRDQREAREQEKARIAARKALLDGAGIRMPVEQFMENWKTQKQASGMLADDYLAYAGCYVLATFASAVKRDDFSTFKELFVGKSERMGADIYRDIVGLGNVDIYADVKYGQHVYVLLFPCAAEKTGELYDALVTALDADQSYNAPKE